MGSSYCGSTVLGMVLGAEANLYNAGEINKYPHAARGPKIERHQKGILPTCTCGLPIKECDFWGRLKSNQFRSLDQKDKPGFSLVNIKLAGQILLPAFKMYDRNEMSIEYEHLVKRVYQIAREMDPDAEWIVDGSKSLQPLYWLAESSQVKVKVIHLIRSPVSALNSFKKHGYGFLYGFTAWVFVNYLGRRYLQRAGLPFLSMSYGDLCQDTESQFLRLNAFLELDIHTQTYIENVNTTEYHLFSGNPLLSKGNDFSGLSYQRGTEYLSKMECHLAKLLNPIHRRMIQGDNL